MNLYLYLPPTSAHPPDTIKSLIFGSIRAYFIQNTHQRDFYSECVQLAKHLLASGWKWEHLSSLFNEAHAKLLAAGRASLLHIATSRRRNKLKTKSETLIFKLPFSPRGVKRQDITVAFKESGLDKLLPDYRLICAQLRSKNIRDRVCRTTLEDIPQANPSDFPNG